MTCPEYVERNGEAVVRVGQGFAREQRNRELGRPGCDDCGVPGYRVRGMIGTAAVRVRCCSECWMYRGFDHPFSARLAQTEIERLEAVDA